MALLYLKNCPVYDIDRRIVLDHSRCPGLLRRDPLAFKQWMKCRYSSNTNSFARALKGVYFGQGNRVKIDSTTHAFSLSDCYWISDRPSLRFEDLSPYFNPFWKGEGEYDGTAVPTLYTNGFLSKYWESSTDLVKKGDLGIEVECAKVARECGVPCAVVVQRDPETIVVKNFTDPRVMLESADMSGVVDPDDFDERVILDVFGKQGLQMIVLDAIFGNGDRHAGNFGFLRSAETGAYLGMAPLYDFDHALDAKGLSDPLLQSAIAVARSSAWREEVLRLCLAVQRSAEHPVFIARAKKIYDTLV